MVHLDDMMGVEVSLDFHFHPADAVRRLLEDSGLTVDWDLRREPNEGEVQTERCYLLARRGTITLRPATEGDRDLLRSFHHACYRRWVGPIWGSDEADQDRRFDKAFGVAGRIIVELADRADRLVETRHDSLPIRLQVLRTNPVRWLYQRIGFTVERETASHLLMVRPAQGH